MVLTCDQVFDVDFKYVQLDTMFNANSGARENQRVRQFKGHDNSRKHQNKARQKHTASKNSLNPYLAFWFIDITVLTGQKLIRVLLEIMES